MTLLLSNSTNNNNSSMSSWLWILPPSLALTYAVSADLFLMGWWEQPSIHAAAWTQRAAVVASSAGMILLSSSKSSSHSKQPWWQPVFQAATVCLSAYLLYDTRIHVIQGGPAPHRPSDEVQDDSRRQLLSSTTTTTTSATERSNANANNNETRPDKRVIVVTGANTGIGKETVRLLALEASLHTVIVLACRNVQKAQEAMDEISQQLSSNNNNIQLESLALDLSSLASVRQAAATLIERHPVLDVLINNAGLMHREHALTVDGYERVWQVNHLGHYLWTRLLLPHMSSSSKSPRIINVTSSTYVLEATTRRDASALEYRLPLEDLHCTTGHRSYTLFGQYALSKLSNILFSYSLAIRLGHNTTTTTTTTTTTNDDDNNKNITVRAVHPGMVRTDVTRYMPWYLRLPNQWLAALVYTLQKTPAQGAWGTVHAVWDSECNNDPPLLDRLYWVNRRPQRLRGLTAASLERESERLWVESAKLVGLPVEDE